MDILAQIINENYKEFFSTQLKQVLEKLENPLVYSPSLNNYVELIRTIDKTFRKSVVDLLKSALEKMDKVYRNSPGRITRYYVKQTRRRTLVTVFGELTYLRTEYIDKYSGEPFCYVDRKLGLRRKERFDSCVQTLIIEGYADCNSMIKVGKLVGDRISGSFNCDPNRDIAISRQTVYNILHRFNSIEVPMEPRKLTPKTLYVMADEKYLATQRGPEKTKVMTKAAIIFEGVTIIMKKDGSLTERNELINKTTVLKAEGDIWQRIYDVLSQLYDMDKVKMLYLMGDGAKWLESGQGDLKPPKGKTKFALDRFHFKQAINRITTDEDTRKILYKYGYHNMKKEFKAWVNAIKKSSPERTETIQENLTYLLNHWGHYQTMNMEVMAGCSMEAAISHVVASQFSSVPKAYSLKNLPLYFNYRELHQNNHDLRNVIITAMSIQRPNEKDIVIPSQEYDFSIFEKKTYPDNPTIREFNKNIITKF